MIKYVANNKNGEFNISSCAAYLSITEKLVITILELYAEAGMINIETFEEPFCLISIADINSDKITSCPKFKEVTKLVSEIDTYRKDLMKREL